MLNRRELRTTGKILLIVVYLVALHMASTVFQESFSVFDYGRF